MIMKVLSYFTKIPKKLLLSVARHKHVEYTSSEYMHTEDSESLAVWKSLQWSEEEHDTDGNPLVSVIVPNYNHAAYLRERLDTIYNQTYSNIEVILLDDCSTDNSCDILMEYAEQYADKTRVVFNETNVGHVFRQWNKGLSLAKGELIWIAESDDYSDLHFLEEMVKCFRYKSVQLAFARSVFMRGERQIWSTEEYLADVRSLRWDMPFTLTADRAVQLGFGYKNIIPNVSSAVFRHIGEVPEELAAVCKDMQLSSDWIFYLAIMKKGCLSYTNQTVNYYRVHEESTSLRVQHTMRYYDEYEMVSRYVAENYDVEDELFQKVFEYLEYHYMTTQSTLHAEVLQEHYHVSELMALRKRRRSENGLPR